jgi:hypothetical protein
MNFFTGCVEVKIAGNYSGCCPVIDNRNRTVIDTFNRTVMRKL